MTRLEQHSHTTNMMSDRDGMYMRLLFRKLNLFGHYLVRFNAVATASL